MRTCCPGSGAIPFRINRRKYRLLRELCSPNVTARCAALRAMLSAACGVIPLIARLEEESKAKASGCHETIGRALRDVRIWMWGFFLIPTFAAAYSYSFTAALMIRDMTGYNKIIACVSLFVAFAILLSGKLASSSGHPSSISGAQPL